MLDLTSFGLGLAHGRVELATSDPRWPAAAGVVISTLREALGDAGAVLEHVGSTAVPELPAKPVLDIAVRLSENADVRRVVERLCDLQLEYRGDKASRGGHLFVAYSATGLPTCHIHVLTHGPTT